MTPHQQQLRRESSRLSIDPELDAAAKYALRVLRRERKPKSPKDGQVCHQGCCQWSAKEQKWTPK